ncbi:MAG: SDR family NAD(P)-dependent oxidoreductase, partial [Opitutaceae bacterium]
PVEYLFTDVSAGFRRQFEAGLAARHPGMRFAVADLDAPLAAQPAAPGTVDVIVAANALHVARRLDDSLRLIRGLLRPGGLLALIEVTRVSLANTLTYGLLDGWWQARDPERRLPDSPLLDVARWRDVLGAEGFTGFSARAEGDPAVAPQAVLLAVSPGPAAAVAEVGLPLVTSASARSSAGAGSGPAPADPRVAARVRAVVRRVFRLEEADLADDRGFDRLGLDSIVAVELAEALNREFGAALRPLDLFNAPNIGALAARLGALPATTGANPPAPAAEGAGPAGADAVAIVGYSLRVPGAEDAEQFWRNVLAGVDATGVVPASRWPGVEGLPPARRRAGLLADIDGFDPLFFGLSGREAELMDPQQRLFLLEAWRALEHAGQNPRDLGGLRAGVFAGCSYGDYEAVLRAAGRDGEAFAFMGNAPSVLPARVAYALNLRGPALAVATACSSSAVALHLAAENLRQGACDLALAGGVSVFCTPRFHQLAGETGMLSASGRCAAFGAGADGIVPAEGVAVLVLKRRADAERDGDRIHGLLLASAVNQDGRSAGLTAPHGPAQAELIGGLYARAGINPEAIGYVECHGTGTRLGDPIEVGALTEAFRRFTARRGYCALGSVKANLGHPLMAAGAVGVIKVLLALRDRRVPPAVHAWPTNPELRLADSPFLLPAAVAPWSADGPALAAVSSFGFSGTNVHLVLAGPPAEPAPAPAAGPWVAVLSGRTPELRRRRAEELAAWLEADAGVTPPAAISHTLATGRPTFAHRLAVTARDAGEAATALRAWLASGHDPRVRTGHVAGGDEPAVPAGATGEALAAAYVAGAGIDWTTVFPPAARRRVPLPPTPFELIPCGVRPVASVPAIPATPAPAPVPLPAASSPLAWAAEWLPVAPARADALAGSWLVAGDPDLVAALRMREPGAAVRECPAAALAEPGSLPHGIVLRLAAAAGGDADPAPLQLVHAIVGRCLRPPPAREVRLVVVVPPAPPPGLAALGAYLATAGQEEPRLRARLVVAAPGDPRLAEELGAADTWREVRLDVAGRFARQLRPAAADGPREDLFRPGGTVLITGGAGGLGWRFSRHLARTRGSRLVWLGRHAAGPVAAARAAEVRALGGEVLAVAGDVTRPEDVARAVVAARERFGALHAVIHAAGVQRPGFIAFKAAAEVAEVVAAKVAGAAALDAVLGSAALDGLLLCSSQAAVIPEPGQADYAWASRWLDEFAVERERARREGRRAGRTVAVNWPMWREGGMTLGRGGDPAAAEALAEASARLSGLRPLTTDEGLALLDRAATHPGGAVLLAHGEAARLGARAAAVAGAAAPGPVASAPEVPGDAALPERVRAYTRDLLAEVLKVPAERLGDHTPLAEYGVDSVLVHAFNARLERDLPDAAKTLLFECHTLARLAEHLHAAHGPALAARLAAVAPAAPSAAPASPAVTAASAPSAPPPADPVVTGDGDIAVIGLAGRFPGAEDLDGLWRLLVSGEEAITAVPPGRWDAAAGARRGGFIAGAEEFDAAFFSLPPVEAETLDPQTRCFLQVAWHALEQAGYARSGLLRRRHGEGPAPVGVFAGVTHNSYQLRGTLRQQVAPTRVDQSGQWTLANRASFFLDLSGPSLPVDTACSASLTALHLACESLRRGECAAALVGGVNLHLHPVKHEAAEALGMLSPTGHCRPFGAGADGYVPGEGVIAAVLKPRAAAERDGDPILALIKASAINHGGRTQGFSVPNPAAQAAVVAAALQRGGIDPRTVTCVEAHGTGTELGDPIELEGLTRAFGTAGAPGACSLGSLKSNLGHLEAAAGLAGLAKLVLQFRHGILAPTLHAAPPNPLLRLVGGPFRLQLAAEPWVRPVIDGVTHPRRAGLSSFGAGGANAHVILEER